MGWLASRYYDPKPSWVCDSLEIRAQPWMPSVCLRTNGTCTYFHCLTSFTITMSPLFNASQTTVFHSEVGSSTSTLVKTMLTECNLQPATKDKPFQNSDEHIRTLLEILLELSPATLCIMVKSLGPKYNNDDGSDKDYHHLAGTIMKMTTSNSPPTRDFIQFIIKFSSCESGLWY